MDRILTLVTVRREIHAPRARFVFIIFDNATGDKAVENAVQSILNVEDDFALADREEDRPLDLALHDVATLDEQALLNDTAQKPILFGIVYGDEAVGTAFGERPTPLDPTLDDAQCGGRLERDTIIKDGYLDRRVGKHVDGGNLGDGSVLHPAQQIHIRAREIFSVGKHPLHVVNRYLVGSWRSIPKTEKYYLDFLSLYENIFTQTLGCV